MNEARSPADVVTLANHALKIEIAPLGAELVRLQDRNGQDFLWNGDPAFWKGRAPLLFPMVGRAWHDRIRVNGSHFPLPQHGFARTSLFECVEATSARCVMRLQANDRTALSYPFAFRLLVAYELQDNVLAVSATVQNPGPEHLPFSLGFHPAFRWPLPGANQDEQHQITFAQPENQPIRRLIDGYLSFEDHPTPVNGRVLALNDALFTEGALIFDQIASRKVSYGASGEPAIEVSFPYMPHFGIWTKPGAPFICIEPWQGFASPEKYDGEFAERPGVISLAPNGERVFTMNIRLLRNQDVNC